jgi:hypothetical protein
VSSLRTPLTELVGIEHPVIQTGMCWVGLAAMLDPREIPTVLGNEETTTYNH